MNFVETEMNLLVPKGTDIFKNWSVKRYSRKRTKFTPWSWL